MFLIIFMGIIFKLMLVSGYCGVDTRDVKNFNWDKFSADRVWYFLLHPNRSYQNDLDCVAIKYGPPVGNMSLVTVDAYVVSLQAHAIFYGNASDWNPSGYWDEIYQPPSLMSGRGYVIAVDYDRYIIFKWCYFELGELDVYVAYRKQHPDGETVEKVREVLKYHNIDINQLAEWPTNHCQLAESPKIQNLGIGSQHFEIFNTLYK